MDVFVYSSLLYLDLVLESCHVQKSMRRMSSVRFEKKAILEEVILEIAFQVLKKILHSSVGRIDVAKILRIGQAVVQGVKAEDFVDLQGVVVAKLLVQLSHLLDPHFGLLHRLLEGYRDFALIVHQ